MKITADIPKRELLDALRFTRARTRGDAVVRAVVDFNKRHRLAQLVRHFGTCHDLMSVEELRALRQKA